MGGWVGRWGGWWGGETDAVAAVAGVPADLRYPPVHVLPRPPFRLSQCAQARARARTHTHMRTPAGGGLQFLAGQRRHGPAPARARDVCVFIMRRMKPAVRGGGGGGAPAQKSGSGPAASCRWALRGGFVTRAQCERGALARARNAAALMLSFWSVGSCFAERHRHISSNQLQINLLHRTSP